MSPRKVPNIGAQLRAIREGAGHSQMDLAAKAGVSISVIFQMEQGKRRDPRLSTLIALAEALGLTVGQLADELVKTEPETKKKGKKPK